MIKDHRSNPQEIFSKKEIVVFKLRESNADEESHAIKIIPTE